MKRIKEINRYRPDKNLLYANHRAPVTRRDFLARGLGAAAGYVLMPSVFDMVSNRLLAAEGCSPASSESTIPMIVFDLPGGNPLGGSFIVGGQSGQLEYLTTGNKYRRWGLPDDIAPGSTGFQPNLEYGVALYPNSGFLLGLNSVITNPAIKANTDGYIALTNSSDDTSSNTQNPAQWLPMYGGRSGSLRPTVGGSLTDSGANSKPALGASSSATKPARVTNANQARSLVSKGRLAEVLADDAKFSKVTSFIKRMSQAELARFSNSDLNQQTQTLIDCGYLNAAELLANFQPNAIFPFNAQNQPDPPQDLIDAFGANPENNPVAVISHLVLNDLVGAASVNVPGGGFDSHDGTAQSARNDAARAGRAVGGTIALAAARNRPICCLVITDGAMGANMNVIDTTAAQEGVTVGGGGEYARPGDGGQFSVSAMFVYIPGAARGTIISNTGRQIGAATPDGTNQSYLITAQNPSNMALAHFKNWGHLNGKEDLVGAANSGTDPFIGNSEAAYRILKKP